MNYKNEIRSDTATALSVVIPALNAEVVLAAAIAPLRGHVRELIVVDGGSVDGTIATAEQYGARVVRSERGRGQQLQLGADGASSDWLLFLHADTVLPAGWQAEVSAFIDGDGNGRRAAVFALSFDADEPAARAIERIVVWRCRLLALPYGDQGLLISRAFYDEIGGFRPIPLYEDVDIVRRIGRRRLSYLRAAARTSAQRYRQSGYVLRPLRNFLLLSLYFLGVPPRILARYYG